ncbi:hypothetical protein OS493_010162 [Desmophyllum pertusum]|uniref:Hexosyltransferase n=1 Tax=Desmophyllum pertusum TaxID=174260 RepID=A0A9W9YEP9_9CNID|nr:hypothetical protein OS493_010162 [Desmophyllum pertusum]
MLSFEKRITDKVSNVMDDMNKQVKDEIEKQKERIEEDINAYFAFLEEDLRSKMTTIDIKAEQNHNNLEQYTPAIYTQNLARRNLIRQTWGAVGNTSVPQWKTYFLLGQTRNQTLTDSLKTEKNNYGDMIRADYYEHYWNQSLKIQMAFEWAARYCNFSFLLKADDDVLVNTKQLIDVLQSKSTPKKGLYMGNLHSHPYVRRDGKWSVSYEEYNQTHYPDFCSGAGFVMSYDVVECVVPLFEVIKPYRIDDVYVGMLAKKSGTIAVDHSGFVAPYHDYRTCNFVPNTLVQHRATGKCLMKLLKMHQIWNSKK